jgi:hypothetical protein
LQKKIDGEAITANLCTGNFATGRISCESLVKYKNDRPSEALLKKTVLGLQAGLPDFSWSTIPKRGKMYQIITKYLYQMAIKYFQ